MRKVSRASPRGGLCGKQCAGTAESIGAARVGTSHLGIELGEYYLNGIEVWRTGGQEAQLRATRFSGGASTDTRLLGSTQSLFWA